MPFPIDNEVFHRSLDYLWLKKPVIDSRILDDMEDLSKWEHQGNGEISLTTENVKDGSHSLRLASPTMEGSKGPVLSIGISTESVIGFPFGKASAIRKFNSEDWTDYNRLSFWVYPHLPGFRTIVMSVILHNDGAVKVPGPYGGRNGRHFILLKPNQWNQCDWEIAHLGRDKVTGVELEYRLQGNEPGANNKVIFDLDHLELQRVKGDHYEGWQVAPGQIAYCHTGYTPSAVKTALASGLASKEFSVISKETGKPVLTKTIEEKKCPEGDFQVMDFTELVKAGTYFIQSGNCLTSPFVIGENTLRETIIKTINFFYNERCGTKVPGIHDYCHGDWICQHEPSGPRYERAYQHDRQIIVNGGWHDAGNLAQGTAHSTAKATYAMFKLVESLSDSDTELSNRLIEEAEWGLDWLLKTRFGDGYRVRWAPMDTWTDNIIGTDDDVKFKAQNSPIDNFVAGLAEAQGAKILKNKDSIRAQYSLQCAEKDWKFAVEELEKIQKKNGHNDNLVDDAAGLFCSVNLFMITGKKIYADKAFEYANYLTRCQQIEIPSWDIPLTGFFYTNEKKEQIYHDNHGSDEYLLMPGLVKLCQLFPDHPDWIKWYTAISLYTNYYKTITEYTRPYGMIPSSIYQIGESVRDYNQEAHGFNEESFRKQILNGIRLSDDYYLRRFPVWFTKRGNTATTLSQASSLSSTSVLRNDSRLEDICRKQLEWNLGYNPFCQSLMYGVGYKYSSMYSAMCGNIIGALPVGIQTDYDKDIPYWPSDVCFNYKELWVHSSALWLLLMSDQYDLKKKLKDTSSAAFHLEISSVSMGKAIITCKAKGSGNVIFNLQGWNLKSDKGSLSINLDEGEEKIIQWELSVLDTGKPCVAIVIPNHDYSKIKDIVFNLKQNDQSGGKAL